jgi:hypothetical protein
MDETNGSVATVAADDLRFRIVGAAAEVFAALAKAAPTFKEIERSKTVRVRPKDQSKAEYEFSYAPLENLVAATRESLSANGLCICQPYHSTRGGWLLRTILGHTSGAYFEAIDFIPATDRTTNQDLGGMLTFRRRYGYAAILGLTSEDDDDANAADGNAAVQVPRGGRSQQRGAGRQQSAPASQSKPPAANVSAGLSLPVGWPDRSEPPTIMRWIDALPENVEAWERAFTALQNNAPLYNSTVDWPPVMTHFANRLRRIIVAKKIDGKSDFCATLIVGEIKRSSEMNAEPPQGTESHVTQTAGN